MLDWTISDGEYLNCGVVTVAVRSLLVSDVYLTCLQCCLVRDTLVCFIMGLVFVSLIRNV